MKNENNRKLLTCASVAVVVCLALLATVFLWKWLASFSQESFLGFFTKRVVSGNWGWNQRAGTLGPLGAAHRHPLPFTEALPWPLARPGVRGRRRESSGDGQWPAVVGEVTGSLAGWVDSGATS